jgi:hypothetical protein
MARFSDRVDALASKVDARWYSSRRPPIAAITTQAYAPFLPLVSAVDYFPSSRLDYQQRRRDNHSLSLKQASPRMSSIPPPTLTKFLENFEM